ncbi:MAG: hypothetical protein A3A80_00995 [Candidatus Terrybacteria bacterium RIFCSPLOWO2_01_FULL_44_24]|uniref:Uncharacterized protein n=1 Tax=Candidatus Terrybacteria bacterium RIFCSPHIGHO2_01_FULL_43_35 TaxID=1802361 RepID=A0A1G2PFS3_9BACT|nr:MAG: hypothetical protein A2828_04130 [Candidatus Terrybacteria bacterium RIFCSPHIGHO2_01_FULL_43_35]OHA49882.1 MAG: hypothetical protein A3B75_03175 [Candidatus Terrybacteria bacterium RIFCSPHIGHO2_02_FULL_43_14]OHA50717.1 MAG: hypothetical protein A3A80_00995 [Candidatus Terrybacteria bacterium RIFCSPLOWO2_01_FULL_44_24]
MENTNQLQASRNSLKNEFISVEPKEYKFKIGKTVASSLSGFVVGFIAGILATGLLWWAWSVSR